MSWLKGSDKAATFPKVLNAPHFSQGRISVNELFGFIMRCSFESAAHRTDYLVDFGVAMMMGGPIYQELIEVAVKCELLSEVESDGAPAWKIIEDPDFVHMITRAEQEWMAQQKKDSRNTKITSQVRRRDGDACRYCGTIVYFGADRRSARCGSYARTGTLDHVISGKAALTPDMLVVACGKCNSSKKDNDDALELLPEPFDPFYSETTAAWLANHDIHVEVSDPRAAPKRRPDRNGTQEPQRPVEQPAKAVPGRTTEATEATPGPASAARTTSGDQKPDNEPPDQADPKPRNSGPNRPTGAKNQPGPAGRLPDRSGFVGSGHGSGRDGQGSAGTVGQPNKPDEPAKPRKRRRRSRKRKP